MAADTGGLFAATASTSLGSGSGWTHDISLHCSSVYLLINYYLILIFKSLYMLYDVCVKNSWLLYIMFYFIKLVPCNFAKNIQLKPKYSC